jgi:hypothetical protein
MSINPFPSCNTSNPSTCAGFNAECFIVDTGTGNPENYLQFPLGQGVETLPGLISLGDVDVGANIIMTGTAGLNYIQFPDDTKQYTAFTGLTTTDNVFTIDGNTLVTPSVYLMNPITLTYPAGTKSFTAYAFSGSGNGTAPVTNSPSPISDGQTLTYNASVTSNSGVGVATGTLPVAVGTSNCCQVVFQPNLLPTVGNAPASSVVFSGLASLTASTQVATFIAGSGNAANIVEGMAMTFTARTLRYGCPSAIVLTTRVTAGNNLVWNYVQGSQSSYYIDKTGLQAVVYNNTNRVKVTVTIVGNILTVNSTQQGTLQVGYYLIAKTFAVFVASQTNATTFVVKGCSAGFTISSGVAYGFPSSNGMDATLAVYSSNTTPTPIAFLAGSNASLTTSSVTGGLIQSLSSLPLTQYFSTPAATQGSISGVYPAIPTITQLALQNSGAVQLGSYPNSSIITNCANSNQKITTFTSGQQPLVTETLGGLGGFGVIFSSV